MLNRKLISLLFVGGCSLPTMLLAQVANGDFVNGTANWSWLRALSTLGNLCTPSVYTPNLGDVPSIGTAPASGRVALLRDQDAIGLFTQNSCTEIRQALTIPAGSQLRLDAQLGVVDNSFPGIFAPVTLSVAFITGNQTHALFSIEGKTQSSTCEVHNSCPRYATYAINMTSFAGQSGTLSVKASTEATAYPKRGSPAFVDNIAFEPAPPPPPPPPPLPPAPSMLDPVYQGGNHLIAWTSSTSGARYVLERAMNTGSWAELYKGSNSSWSGATPLSGSYRYRVAIITGTGKSPYSREVTVRAQSPSISPVLNYLLD